MVAFFWAVTLIGAVIGLWYAHECMWTILRTNTVTFKDSGRMVLAAALTIVANYALNYFRGANP